MINAFKSLLVLAAVSFGCLSAVAAPHTPQAGSEERKAICDAVREKVVGQATRKLPQPIVFKVDFLRVDEGYAWFEGTPRFKDGSFVPGDFLPDVAYIMMLQKTGSGWKVKEDLSRSDVPSGEEAAQLQARLKFVPTSIIPDSWRRTLSR